MEGGRVRGIHAAVLLITTQTVMFQIRSLEYTEKRLATGSDVNRVPFTPFARIMLGRVVVQGR